MAFPYLTLLPEALHIELHRPIQPPIIMSKSLKHKTWVEISKRALVNNAQAFRDIIHKDVRMMGVVKSNAYGHGLIDTAKTIDPYVDWFGVDNLDEAKLLKKNKIKKPILTLGFTPSWRMAEAARMGVSIVVASEEQLRAARAGSKKTKRKLKVHIKVETGTTRQGFSPNKLPDVGKMILDSKYLKFEGLSTHFADIEDTTDHAYAGRQLENFIKSIELLEAHGIEPEIKHTACTAAAAVYPDTHFDLVRVGIGLYGIWPSEETKRAVGDSGANLPLEPALTWKTRIAQIKEVKSGTPISYGLTEKMPYNGKLAVLGVSL